MYNFKSKLLILLLGIVLLVPAVYCFSIFGYQDSVDSAIQGQNDTSQSDPTDDKSSIKINGKTGEEDISIDNDDTTEKPSLDDGDSTKDSTSDDNEFSKDASTGDNDTSKNSAADGNDVTQDSMATESPNNGTDTIQWPVIVIVEDNSQLIKSKSESDSRRVDTNNNWLVVNKRTSIRKVEEVSHDFGKTRRVLNEDKSEELRVYRDNLHTVVRSGVDLTNVLMRL